MTFQDRTFCFGGGCTKFDTCPRAYTPAVEKAARAWWGGPGAPVSVFLDPGRLACFSAPVAADPDDEEDPGEDIDNFPTATRRKRRTAGQAAR